jgi:hypothetical protein
VSLSLSPSNRAPMEIPTQTGPAAAVEDRGRQLALFGEVRCHSYEPPHVNVEEQGYGYQINDET